MIQSEETATVVDLAKEAEAALSEAKRYMYFSRSKECQKEQRQRLFVIKERVRGFKRGAATAQNEVAANQFFHIQCILNGAISHIDMLVHLKGRDFHKAWDKLIDAYEYLSVAEKAMAAANAGKGFATEDFRTELEHAEKAFFPPMPMYQSWGVVMQGGRCSVCSKPFSECNHSEGRVYWGKLCVRLEPEIVECDHVAMVKDPKDRRCIITGVERDGHMRDHFTWKQKEKVEVRDEHLSKLSVVIFNNGCIEID